MRPRSGIHYHNTGVDVSSCANIAFRPTSTATVGVVGPMTFKDANDPLLEIVLIAACLVLPGSALGMRRLGRILVSPFTQGSFLNTRSNLLDYIRIKKKYVAKLGVDGSCMYTIDSGRQPPILSVSYML